MCLSPGLLLAPVLFTQMKSRTQNSHIRPELISSYVHCATFLRNNTIIRSVRVWSIVILPIDHVHRRYIMTLTARMFMRTSSASPVLCAPYSALAYIVMNEPPKVKLRLPEPILLFLTRIRSFTVYSNQSLLGTRHFTGFPKMYYFLF